MINTSTKFNLKSNYEQLYHNLTNNHYSKKEVSKLSPYKLMMAINVALQVHDCIMFTEEEVLNISSSVNMRLS